MAIDRPDEGQRGSAKPRLLDQLRGSLRARHYARSTERAYVHWAKRYIRHPGRRFPQPEHMAR